MQGTTYVYLGVVDESLECMVCREALVDPVVEPGCRVTFCRACLVQWLAREPTCPNCRGRVQVATLQPAPLIITNALDALLVACPVCESQQRRGDLARHIQLCPKPCGQGCGQVVAPSQLLAHKGTCPAVPVQCPSSDIGCAVVLPRRDLDAHVKACPLVPMRPFFLRMRALEEEVSSLKQALKPRGRFLRAWGAKGSADGQFLAPCGLAVAPGSRGIVVADHNNHRVQVFDAKGRFVGKFGGEGATLGRFYHPRGVATLALAVPQGGPGGQPGLQVLVADRDNHRVQVFDNQGKLQSAFGGQGRRNGQMQQPWGVAVDAQRGHVFVSDSGNHRVQAFDMQGNFLLAFGTNGDQEGQLQQPCGIAVDRRRGLVWVADTDNHRVQVFDGQGRFQRAFGVQGAGEGRFQYPRDIVVVEGEEDVVRAAQHDDALAATRVFVTDNHRVQAFDGHGRFLGAIGREGQAEGCFDHPRGVAVDHKGRIFVADSANHRVQVFTFGCCHH